MLINNNDSNLNHVEFISYTGEYPCLCVGALTLKIDGEEVKFGADKTGKYSHIFWDSGGGLYNNDDVYEGEWKIDVNRIPDQYKKYATEIDMVFNANVKHGCCGGCS